MPAFGDIGDLLKIGIGGAAGALPGTTATGNSTTDTTTSGTTSGTSSQQNEAFQNLLNFLNTLSELYSTQQTSQRSGSQLDPVTQQFLDKIRNQYSNLTTPTSLTGYRQAGLNQINQNSDLQRQSVDSVLASRGIGNSPAGATSLNNVESQRFNNINQFEQGLPVLQNQLDIGNLGAAGGFFSRIPNEQYQFGDQFGQQRQTGSQSGVQQGNSLSNINNQTTSQQNVNNRTATNSATNPGGGGITGFLKGLLPVAASLFSDERLKEAIKPIDSALDRLRELPVVEWRWKGSDRTDTGVLAQDLQKLIPDLVEDDDPTGFLKVDYAGLIPYLLGGIKELDVKVSKLRGV